jgi:hypothetical protein
MDTRINHLRTRLQRQDTRAAGRSGARLVGPQCNLDDLIRDIVDELGRPYDIVFVAGGWQFRTRPRFAGAIRAAKSSAWRDAGAPELTPTELLALTAIAYLQPATRAELSRLAGKEISRDVIGRLKRLDLIDGALRAPEPTRHSLTSRRGHSCRHSVSPICATCPISKGWRTRGCCCGPNRSPISTAFWQWA